MFFDLTMGGALGSKKGMENLIPATVIKGLFLNDEIIIALLKIN